MSEEFWRTVRGRQRSSYRAGRTGALNFALLFGVAAIALSLIVTPRLAERSEARRLANMQGEFDRIVTGSIRSGDKVGKKTYIIRRSVLQETPDSICVLHGDGKDC